MDKIDCSHTLMPEANKHKIEVESELYGLINTIINLYGRYHSGEIRDSFFKKSIKNTTNDLLKLNLYLNEKNIVLLNLLEDMKFTNEYFRAIHIINEVSSLDFDDPHFISIQDKRQKYSDSISSSLLELPGLTSEITSTFITLLDALKLDDFVEPNLILKLFDDLNKSFTKFPGLESIKTRIDEIHEFALKNKLNLIDNKTTRDLLGEDLYQIYKDFQSSLNLKT